MSVLEKLKQGENRGVGKNMKIGAFLAGEQSQGERGKFPHGWPMGVFGGLGGTVRGEEELGQKRF